MMQIAMLQELSTPSECTERLSQSKSKWWMKASDDVAPVKPDVTFDKVVNLDMDTSDRKAVVATKKHELVPGMKDLQIS